MIWKFLTVILSLVLLPLILDFLKEVLGLMMGGEFEDYEWSTSLGSLLLFGFFTYVSYLFGWKKKEKPSVTPVPPPVPAPPDNNE